MISTLCTDVRFQLQCTSHWTRKSIFFFPFPLLEIWDLSSPYVLTKSDANCFGDFSHFRVTVKIGKWNFEKLVFFFFFRIIGKSIWRYNSKWKFWTIIPTTFNDILTKIPWNHRFHFRNRIRLFQKSISRNR